MDTNKVVLMIFVTFAVGAIVIAGKCQAEIGLRCSKECGPYRVAYCVSNEVGCYTADETAIRRKRF